MTEKCRWCGREDVEVTLKGGLAPHVDASGRCCVAIGIRVDDDRRTRPRDIKGPVQRNQRRKRKR